MNRETLETIMNINELHGIVSGMAAVFKHPVANLGDYKYVKKNVPV